MDKCLSLLVIKVEHMKTLIKKIGLVLIAVLMLALPAAAQVAFGVRAGGAYSAMVHKIDDVYDVGARFGFSVATLADIPIYRGFSIRPEVAFANQGGTYSALVGTDPLLPSLPGPFLSERKYSYYSLQVPVNLAYTFVFTDVRLSVFAGPTFDFPLFGKMKEGNVSHQLNFGDKTTDNLKGHNVGVNLGLAVEYSNFFFSINSISGTADRRPTKIEGESSVYQNNVTLSLGYFFR